MRKGLALLSAFAIFVFSFSPIDTRADGVETLGEPSVVLQGGSNVVVAGTGLKNFRTSPGILNFAVPAGASIRQVLLYWAGFYDPAYPPENNGAFPSLYDIVLTRSGNSPKTITGYLIGGPTEVFGKRNVTYRADITSSGLVTVGSNSIEVTFPNTYLNVDDGAGIVVTYDDGSGIAPLLLKDGNDYAFDFFSGTLGSTVPQTFSFTPSTQTRQTTLKLFFSGVPAPECDQPWPTSIEVIVGVGDSSNKFVFSNRLVSSDGAYWDTLQIPVEIPAGVGAVTVAAFSRDDAPQAPGNCHTTPSLVWDTALLLIPDGIPTCAVGGPYKSTCSGATTSFTVSGAGSASASGLPLSYSWATTCAESKLVPNTEPSSASLGLTLPGKGQEQSCNVSLTVQSGLNQSTCTAPVFVSACDTCADADATTDVTELEATLKAQRRHAVEMLNWYAYTPCGRSSKGKKYYRTTSQKIKKLYSNSLEILKSIPVTVNSCSDTCIQSESESQKSQYEKNVNEIAKLDKQTITLRSTCKIGDGRCNGSIKECRERQQQGVSKVRAEKKLAQDYADQGSTQIKGIPCAAAGDAV